MEKSAVSNRRVISWKLSLIGIHQWVKPCNPLLLKCCITKSTFPRVFICILEYLFIRVNNKIVFQGTHLMTESSPSKQPSMTEATSSSPLRMSLELPGMWLLSPRTPCRSTTAKHTHTRTFTMTDWMAPSPCPQAIYLGLHTAWYAGQVTLTNFRADLQYFLCRWSLYSLFLLRLHVYFWLVEG